MEFEHSDAKQFSPEMIEEARRTPGGWLYETVGDYGDGDVPPEAIRGAWVIDDHGSLTGEYIPNPNYRSSEDS